MIQLTGYDISTREGVNYFKIFFKATGSTDSKIKIEVWDRVFKTTEYSNVVVDVNFGGNYWAEVGANSHIVNQGQQLTTKFNFGVVLKVIGLDSGGIQEIDVPFLITEVAARKPGFSNTWIIGDSNVAYLFKNKPERFNQFNGVSHLSLSMNRFSKSDATDFYRSIPLIENDTVLFLFGEIDIRASIIRNSRLKNESIEDSTCKIFDRFMAKVSEFRENYPLIKFAVLMPPPPFSDSVKLGEHVVSGTAAERMSVYNLLKSMLSYYLRNELIDCYSDYLDNDGFVRSEFLNPGDHHILISEPFFNSLAEIINKK